jgi:starvation-inducible DNA-binding protein
MFTTLHTLFMTQYTELSLAVDEIAERIRAIGAPAPGSYAEFSKRTALKEAIGVPPAIEMLEQLVHDQVLVGQAARAVVDAAERAGDAASADLGVRRIQIHEKNAWMLRVHLEG